MDSLYIKSTNRWCVKFQYTNSVGDFKRCGRSGVNDETVDGCVIMQFSRQLGHFKRTRNSSEHVKKGFTCIQGSNR